MKTFILTLLLAVTATAQAQTVPWVSYTPSTYRPRSSGSSSYSDPMSSINAELAEMERIHLQRQAQNQVIESEIINSSAVSSATGNLYPIQVRTELKRNGNFTMKCIGIKMNNQWVSCENDLFDLQDLYKQATTQADKSSLLELMEIGSFIFMYNNTLYLIPKK